MSSPAAETVAVVAFDGISPFHLSVPCMVFGEDRTDAGASRFRVQVCASEPGELRTNAGFSLVVPHGLEAIRRARIVVVPSWRDDCSAAPPALIRALQAAHRRGATVMGLCLGAFVLAEAGLLGGRRATTHWYWADALQQRYPEAQVEADRIYIADGPVWTSAGMTAELDLALALVEKDLGADIARSVAHHLVMHQRRSGGQSQHSEMLRLAPKSDRIQQALDHARRNLSQHLSVEDLAEAASLSPRQFSRVFTAETGQSPAKAVEGLRLEAARLMIESSRHPLEVVARETGFRDRRHLREAFLRGFGMPPQAVRREARDTLGVAG